MPRLVLLAGAFLTLTGLTARAQLAEVNVLTFARGALIERVTSTASEEWDAIWLLDENPATGWSTGDELTLPVTIVISLPQQSRVSRFEFDTALTDPPDTAARDVDILISDTSANTGFIPLATARLKPNEDRQRVVLASPGVGRWVKLVVHTTNGSATRAELMNVRGFGLPLTSVPPPDASGTYDSGKYGRIHLRQEGATLSGCYEKDGGLIHGGVDGPLLLLRWREPRSGGGPALMVPFRDGTGFRGLWQNEGETLWKETWDLRKVSGETGACAHWVPGTASANPVAAGLLAEGRVRLHGILFDASGGRLHPDAKPGIGQIVEALTTHPDWSITIEDHSEAMETAGGGRALSERRAAAVKAALMEAGIASGRVTAAGLGWEQPVADKETALGRAQNRRVEVVRR